MSFTRYILPLTLIFVLKISGSIAYTQDLQYSDNENQHCLDLFNIPLPENSADTKNWSLFGGDLTCLPQANAQKRLNNSSIDVRTPEDEIYERLGWPDPRINFLPGGLNTPAGDLTGNGLPDMIRVYFATDERDDNPETVTWKTFVYEGGSELELTDPDFILYDQMHAIGDINGSGKANLVSNSDFNNRKFYEYNGSEFVEIPTGNLEEHLIHGIYSSDFSIDADGDGYGDRVYFSFHHLNVYFGAEDISDSKLIEYNLIDFLEISHRSASDYLLKNVTTVNGEAYFLFRFIIPAYVDPAREEGRYLAILKLDQNRELKKVQEFKISNNIHSLEGNLFTAMLPGDDNPSLIYFNLSESFNSENTSGYNSFRIRPSEVPDLLFEEGAEPFYSSLTWPAGDLTGDGNTDFIVLNDSDTFYYHGEYSETEIELVLGDKLPFQDEIRQLHIAQSNFPVFGDNTGNGYDDYFVMLESGVIIEGEPSIGMLRISGDELGNYLYEPVVYQLRDYQRTMIENIFVADDVTGNGVEDFFIYYTSTQNMRRELVLHQGGSNWKEPYKTWAIDEDRILMDLTAGHFTSTDRRDIAILTRLENPVDGNSKDQIEFIEGGSAPSDNPYFVINPRDYAEGLSDQHYNNYFFGMIENAGDVNNSGYDEILISTPQKRDPEGDFLPPGLYFGGEQLSQDGPNRFLYIDEGYLGSMDNRGSFLGSTMKGLGDITGNGIDDFAISDIEAQFEETWDFGNHAVGAVHIYYGVDEEEPQFSSPDLTLRSDKTALDNNASFYRFGLSEIATGDFNGDGLKDIAVKPQVHLDRSMNQGIPGVHLFHQAVTDGQPQQLLPLHSNLMNTLYNESESSFLDIMISMRMAGIPDITGNGHDELLIMASSPFTNAVLHLGNEHFSDEPDILFQLPNRVFPVSTPSPSIERQHRIPVGDITGNGEMNLLMWQDDPAYRDNPIYMYEISEIFVSNEPMAVLPEHFNLAQNYPNPFNPVTVVGYQLPVQSDVKLEVFDLLGRRVAVLVDERQAAGTHQAEFDASHLASGVYLYRLQSDDFVQTRQMVLVK